MGGPHAGDLRRRTHGGPCRAEQCALGLPLPGLGPAPSGGLTTNSRRTGEIGYTCICCSRMDQPFVERRDDGLYVVGSRVPLDSIVLEFRDGQSPEAIRSDFPTLSLEQVYGAITFYLGHKEEVDREIAAHQRVEDAFSSSH